jgi:two-component system, OmpR family, sensor histidine kinase MprB
MTLRMRIAAIASLSVAVAVLAAAIGLYVAVRSDLRGEIDSQLRARAGALAGAPGRSGGAPLPGASGSPGPSPLQGIGSGPPTGRGDGAGDGGFPERIQPAPFGGASGYIQLISAQGSVFVPGGQGTAPARIAPSAEDLRIARTGSGSSFSDRTVGGTSLRVLTYGAGAAGAVLIARPLSEVNHELGRLVLILALIGCAGILLAALLGALVARTALAPVRRFTEATETLSGNLDLSRRLEVRGRDELARLAESFNASLDALERSVAAQRHLIADASHELRTPISSLRANIQVLGEASRLPAEDQASLREDIVAELDELTALVGDVVELARGAAPEEATQDVRLDEVVAGAVERARRRGGVSFEVSLEPTVVRGRGERIARAVSNLLDNARKWSPPGAVVEVALAGGVLSVRDHGPGFGEADLPFVFDRFYRAADARGLPGSGLGLAIVRQAAESAGGFAQAANAKGGGALLRVGFSPTVSSAPGEPIRDAGRPPGSRAGRT